MQIKPRCNQAAAPPQVPTMPMVKQPLTVEHALLGFVRRQPMYGYEIYQHLLESVEMGLVWNIKQSMLYALLTRLEDEGYLSSTLEHQSARPARKILSLTPEGEQAFLNWVRSPVPHGRDFRLEFLAKLYFACAEGSADAQALINAQRTASILRRDELRAQLNTLTDQYSYDWLVLSYRVGQLDATLAWLELCNVWVSNTEQTPGARPITTPDQQPLKDL
jgi:PadR family transcriptional regulator AphA